MNLPSKEVFQDYYKEHSNVQTSQYFNICIPTLQKWLVQFNITPHTKGENMKFTSLERYGVTNGGNSKQAKEKAKKTCLEKYGCENPNQNAEVKAKQKQAMLNKYGCHISQLENIKQQKKDTFLAHYGVDNIFKSEEFKEKNKDYFLQKRLETESRYPEKFRPLLNNKELAIEFLQEHQMTRFQLADYFDVKVDLISNWIKKLGLQDYIIMQKTRSHFEDEIYEAFKDLGFTDLGRRDLLGNNQEIDLYNPVFKIGIEFNGNLWHSDIYKDKNYHQVKSIIAQEKSIRLIHIYEYEWLDPIKRDIIKSLISISCGKLNKRIYARECEIREISNKQAKPFNNLNHLQGHRNAQITYGLFYENELVQLMSFSKSKYNKNLKADDSWEIIRGCPGSNNIVIGGVAKLFKHFIKQFNPNEVFSYCDFNKFDGRSYEAIGMKFVGYTEPDKTWIIGEQAIKRSPHKYQQLKEKADGIIWGAGSKKYLWVKN